RIRLLDREHLLGDLLILSLGGLLALVWELNPWLSLFVLLQLILLYRILQIPQLEKQARTDEKTGLWNARYFDTLFHVELERAKRFARPLAVVMADLDWMRDLNNT